MNGILMKQEMNLAIREDRKSVTRRLDHLKEINLEPDKWNYLDINNQFAFAQITKSTPSRIYYNIKDAKYIKPHYHVGEIIYVKEPIEVHNAYGESNKESYLQGYMVIYQDKTPRLVFLKDIPKNIEIKPFYQKMFMPAWSARTFLKITNIRPERLKDITDEEAYLEGMNQEIATKLGYSMQRYTKDGGQFYLEIYKHYWDFINPSIPFLSNPWVWRYEFKKVNP